MFSLALCLQLLEIKLVRNVPSSFPSLLELVQHGSDLSLGGVLSPIIRSFQLARLWQFPLGCTRTGVGSR